MELLKNNIFVRVHLVKKITDAFKITMLIVGAVIGAGFASGREIAEMLYGNGAASYLTVIAMTAVMAVICTVVMLLAKKLRPSNVGQFNTAVFGKGAAAVDIMVLVNCFVVLAAMIAGMSGITSRMGVGGYIILPIACAGAVFIVLKKDISRLIKVNLVIMPIIIVVIVIVALPFAASDGGVLAGRLRAIPALLYVCMNLILAVGALIRVERIEHSSMIAGAVIASVIIGGLIWVMLAAISASPDAANEAMPLFALSYGRGALTYVLRITMILAIFTSMAILLQTLVDWGQSIVKNRFAAASVIMLLAFALSLIGFSNIIAWFYPVAGVFGIVYLAWIVGHWTLSQKTGSKRLDKVTGLQPKK